MLIANNYSRKVLNSMRLLSETKPCGAATLPLANQRALNHSGTGTESD